MRFINWISDLLSNPKAHGDLVEYRLACSGELFNGDVHAPDHRKSTITRILLSVPFELLVASSPYDAYPQELALRFECPFRTDKNVTHRPDGEIAGDLCALLTLFARRFVALGPRIAESLSYEQASIRRFPHPVLFQKAPPAWSPRSDTVIYHPGRPPEFCSNQPPAVEFDAKGFVALLAWVTGDSIGPTFVHAARLYATAMQFLKQRPDVAYLLLVAASESVANAVLKDYSPAAEQIVSENASDVRVLRDAGLSEGQATEAVLALHRKANWSKKKFVKFLSEQKGDLSTTDFLHESDTSETKRVEDVDSALSKIYAARSAALHRGVPFPAEALVVPGVPTSVDAQITMLAGAKGIPPVTWFERIVQHALVSHARAHAPEPPAGFYNVPNHLSADDPPLVNALTSWYSKYLQS